jgi:hypothetical protein
MRTLPIKRQPAGFVSYLLVLTTATLLSLLSIYAYRRAMTAHKIESQVQLRIDYSEKDEAILRAIVASVPNKAMLAMQPGSVANSASLSWAKIFEESLDMANSRTSIPAVLEAQMGLPAAGVRKSNTTDSTSALLVQNVFREIQPINTALPGLVTTGSGPAQALGANYPPVLDFWEGPTGATALANDIANDKLYPVITNTKQYGTLARGRVKLEPETTPGASGTPGTDYQRFNLMPYPQINFGYGTPGEDFIAKRNWWAFSLDVGAQDAASTNLARVSRDFVLSIYEIPSQLSISSASYTVLGKNVDIGGGDWLGGRGKGRVNIDGGIFSNRAAVPAPGAAEAATAINGLTSRRGMDVAAGAKIGGVAGGTAFAGDREDFQNTKSGPSLSNNTTLGEFYPMSLASESGRCAFIPISPGEAFYDRFMQEDFAFDKYNPNPATNSISSTAWNDYTIGARQCAMQLDITAVQSSVAPLNFNTTTTQFSYLVKGVRTTITTTKGEGPDGYIRIRGDGESFDFGNTPTDVAYGSSELNIIPLKGVTGIFKFENASFPGSSLVSDGRARHGYMKSAFKPIASSGPKATDRQEMEVYPEKFPLMLAALGADGASVNNSLVVNVNYRSGVGSKIPTAPAALPNTTIASRYTLVVRECADLTAFTKGFSLVTNMNLNLTESVSSVAFQRDRLPSNYTPKITSSNPDGLLYPPCSIFAPSNKYGNTGNELSGVVFGGQLNSLKNDDGTNSASNRVNPLKAVVAKTGEQMAQDNLTFNLRQITHPLELPPINMMNWLVLLEEKRREY